MRKWQAFLGYGAALLASGWLLAIPFGLLESLAHGIGMLGLRPDPVTSGGEHHHRIVRGDYVIDVNQPVYPRGVLGRVSPFVQIRWSPLGRLPARVEDAVDLDGDGKTDLVARFERPSPGSKALAVDITPQSPRVRALEHVTRRNWDALIARVGDAVVVRVPLVKP